MSYSDTSKSKPQHGLSASDLSALRSLSTRDSVLIIDDDVALCEELSEFIEDLGLACVAVHDGNTGLLAIEEMAPRVVLADIQMPILNGLEVAATTRQKHPDISVVLMSGTKRNETECQDDQGEYHVILPKPLPLDRLEQFLKLTFGMK